MPNTISEGLNVTQSRSDNNETITFSALLNGLDVDESTLLTVNVYYVPDP